MSQRDHQPIAVIGIGARMPGAPDAETFFQNICDKICSITDVPLDRWDPALYWDPDPKAPDKTYSRIGGFLDDFKLGLRKWRIPPMVARSVDDTQLLALDVTEAALADAGLTADRLPRERCAVILGNAIGGDLRETTAARMTFRLFEQYLLQTAEFAGLPQEAQQHVLTQLQEKLDATRPAITEDTMAGELSNVVAGRVASAYRLTGPNYTVDAACASSLAALSASVGALRNGECDVAITGGVDRNMCASGYVKFCKTHALSAEGSTPFDERANGFVMGEGGAVLILKRLEDALADGDRVRAVIRGVGGSSDGGAKGLTAPSSDGQLLALRRAYEDAEVPVETVGLIEAHGTSTRVGDATEVQTLCRLLEGKTLPGGPVALSSVKSNIGHLKSAAGAASLVKAVLALERGVLPPTAGFKTPIEALQGPNVPVQVQTELEPWTPPEGTPRRAGVSAFGFGGTNFHVVLEEHRPEGPALSASRAPTRTGSASPSTEMAAAVTLPEVGLLRLGAPSREALSRQLGDLQEQLGRGDSFEDLTVRHGQPIHDAAVRAAITAADSEELTTRIDQLIRLLDTGKGKIKLAGAGTYLGEGPAPDMAFLFPGQGSQYVGMLGDLLETLPSVGATLSEADAVMAPILGRPLTDYLFGRVSLQDETHATAAAMALQQTTVTQPAVLAADVALLRVFADLGLTPDVVAGHSLGEYAAGVAAGVLPLDRALRIVAARGREMSGAVPEGNDPGQMAVVAAPADQVVALLAQVDGYVVAANKNSPSQTVIAGESDAVQQAMASFEAAGLRCMQIPVSHAFHSRVVAAASEPLRKVLQREGIRPAQCPIYSNVTAELYPTTEPEVLDLLARQVASPVEWIGIIERMYERGVRTFVEIGPKRALAGFARDILAGRPHRATHTNHPKKGGPRSLVEALALLSADGQTVGATRLGTATEAMTINTTTPVAPPPMDPTAPAPIMGATPAPDAQVVITGVAAGLPGMERLFGDDHLDRLLAGESLLDRLDTADQQTIVDQHIERLVKSADGTGSLEPVDSPEGVMAWAGRGGKVDLTEDYRLPASWDRDRDATTRLGVAAAFEALADGWLPLVEHRRNLSNGRTLGEGFRLPASLAETTGVIFASAFPGYERLVALTLQNRDEVPFPRNALLQILGLGHAHIAELLGAMGPNTMMNTACASTTTAVAMAQDWIRCGRCERVLVVGADDVTSPQMLPWIGSGFLALGAATTERALDHAAVPFGRQRNGMILGMGAVGLLVESAASARRRGVRARAEIVATRIANSAAHPLRLRPDHIAAEVDRLVTTATERLGIDRAALARELVFMSHETYTPARGGSAQAEVDALRGAFGPDVGEVLVVNTKGFTGHAMAAGIEDAAVVAGLWSQSLPPVANLHDPDPDFADLTFHRGGPVQRRYALRLAAGFGSQIALTLYRRPDGEDPRVEEDAFRGFLSTQCGVVDGVVVKDHRLLRARAAHRDKDDTLEDALTLAQRRAETSEIPTMSQTPSPTVPMPEPVVAPPAPQPAPTAGITPAEVLVRLQAVVAERTGYDLEELEPDLELEADLGIDTVKQAEIVGELREAYHLERDDAFRLSEHPTLEALADYVVARVAPAAKDAPVEETVEATAPAPQPAAPAPQTATPGVSRDAVLAKLQAVVAERTGYDLEELEPDLELEADLGIDTVKQAEIVGELREAYHLERDDSFRLSEHPTLEALADYVVARVAPAAPAEETVEAAAPAPQPAAPQPATPTPQTATPTPQTATPGVSRDAVLAKLQAVVAERTGYDLEELEPDLELEADLGIDTVKQAEIVGELREAYHLERDDAFRLSEHPTLEALADYVVARVAPTEAAPTEETAVVAEPAPVEIAPATVAPEAATPAPQRATTAVSRDAVLERLQAVVAERTGYDLEELEPDLELEADLGIDTVKQAEIVGELREAYHLERDDAFRLSEHPTLEALADYVVGRIAPAAQAAQAVEAAAPEAAQTPETVTPVAPVPFCTDLGEGFHISKIQFTPGNADPTTPTLEPRGRVLVVGSTMDHGAQVVEGLLGPDARTVYLPTDRLLSISEEDLTRELASWADPAPLQGVINLLGWEQAPPDGADAAPALFRLARALERHAPQAAEPAPVSFFLTVLGMNHAEQGGCPTHETPRTGALAGLTRALAREWTGATVRVVGVTAPHTPAELGALLGTELCIPRKATDVVWRDGTPHTLQLGGPLEARPLPLEGTTVLITGGSGGLGALLARRLSERGCRLVLTGLDRLPESQTDTAPSRTEVRESLKAEGLRATPALVNRELARHDREQKLATLVHELTGAGTGVRYLSADLMDETQLDALVADIRQHEGHLDVVLHAAGLERSRPLLHKPPTEFETVYGCKATAGQKLWSALCAQLPELPRRFVAFSSVAGLFGNAGQTDYAAANASVSGLVAEINRTAEDAAAGTRATTTALAIHWTGWDDVGMTANSPIADLLRERGVRLLPADMGSQVALDLLASDLAGEVLVAGPLGELAGDSAADLAPQAAGQPEATSEVLPQAQPEQRPDAPERTLVCDPDGQRATLRYELSPEDPWLADHAVEGVALLPAVAGLELMARAARGLHPGARVTGLRNARFASPLKVQPGRRITAIVEATPASVPGRVQATLTSERVNRAGRVIRQDHFTAEVDTTVGAPTPPETRPPLHLGALDRRGPEAEEIYRHFFHGPAFQVLDTIRLVGTAGLVARGRGKRLPLDDGDGLIAPLALEAALQAAGFHALLNERSQALPAAIGQLTLTGAATDLEQASELVLRVRAAGDDGGPQTPPRHRFDVDLLDAQGQTLMRCRDVVLIQRAAVEPSDLPTTSALLEVVEIAVDSLGRPDAMVMDLEAELGPAERRQAVDIAHPGRRLDWIAGRLAAKELVRLHLRDRYGVALPRRRVEVATDPGGAPVPWVPARPGLAALLPALSITHACGRAMALGVPTSDPGVRVGVDLAPVELRPDSFEKQWLTDHEQRLLIGADADQRALLVSQLWALKEATSKALGLGLQLSTAELEIQQLHADGTATLRLSGMADQRFGDLGATTLRAAVLDWHGAVLAWARLDLGGDTDAADADAAKPLQGLRETHIQPVR